MSEIAVTPIGHITGLNGTGVVYQLLENGRKIMAVIEGDNKFHELTKESLLDHIGKGLAAVTVPLADSYESFDLNNIVTSGFERFYKQAENTGGTQTPTSAGAVVEIPYKFEGVFKIDLSQLQNLFSILTTD